MTPEEIFCDICGFPYSEASEENPLFSMQGVKNVCLCCHCAINIGFSAEQVYKTANGIEDTPDTFEKPEEKSVRKILNKTGNITPSQLKKHLDKHVIGQEEAKMVLSVAIYNHYKKLKNNMKSKNTIAKNNILLIGPTGCGKTELARSIAKKLQVPFVVTDATSLTEAGYAGDDAESILLSLINNANGDIAAAECGIIYIDEIDKIAKSGDSSASRDVSGEGVQQALLKIIEGSVVRVSSNNGRKHPMDECYEIDTSNILFICSGAFDGLEKIINKSKGGDGIGFGRKLEKNETKVDFSDIQPEHLVKYGIIPELIGRLPVITTLKELTREEMFDILVKPENSIVKQYKALFKMDDISLNFEKSALESVVDVAISKKLGARGLRSIMEKSMVKTMFMAPDDKSISRITITKDCIINNKEPKIKRKVN